MRLIHMLAERFSLWLGLAYSHNRLQGSNDVNPFRNLSHPSKSFKPVKEMILQELMYLIIIIELSIALLKMFDPVETGILKF